MLVGRSQNQEYTASMFLTEAWIKVNKVEEKIKCTKSIFIMEMKSGFAPILKASIGSVVFASHAQS